MSVELEVRPFSGGAPTVLPLPHGADLTRTLQAAGWRVVRHVEAVRAGDAVRIVLEAEPVTPAPTSERPEPRPLAADPGLVVEPGEEAHPFQRVAVYAAIEHDGRVLLTQLADHVAVVGRWWNLPGGGLDPGEEPAAGLRREVWEETGHEVVAAQLVHVETQHWIGRSPQSRLEDFHAVRLVHRAQVAEVVEPVVHDVDGSTAQARWVPLDELADLPLVRTVEAAFPGAAG